MVRPKSEQPTPAELELLQILWERGPMTVREMLNAIPQDRAYTSVMSLMNVMTEKKLLTREPEGRAFRYTARFRADQTQRKVLRDMLERVFQGSASALVARLLEQAKPTASELDAIHGLIADYKQQQKGKP